MILQHTTAIVTGASRGIGQYIARALAARGIDLALVARDHDALERFAGELATKGARAVPVPGDLSRADQRDAVVARCLAEFTQIDILVNNAGIEPDGAFLDMTSADIERTAAINIVAPMALARLVLPAMVSRGSGHVVNIASLAGKRGAPYDAVYSGSKAAVVQWTHALRLELQGTGVCVSVVCPGFVRDVGMFSRFGVIPPASLGTSAPQDVAAAVVRAIEKRRPEILVSARPLRPLLAVGELFPSLADKLMNGLGVTDFQRRKVMGDPPAPGNPPGG